MTVLIRRRYTTDWDLRISRRKRTTSPCLSTLPVTAPTEYRRLTELSLGGRGTKFTAQICFLKLSHLTSRSIDFFRRLLPLLVQSQELSSTSAYVQFEHWHPVRCQSTNLTLSWSYIKLEVTDLTDFNSGHQPVKARNLRFGPTKEEFLQRFLLSLSFFLSFFLSLC